MIVYDKTEFNNSIDLNGTDIEQAKFPRVDRDGLFIDEVRSNPTTGLLEIWDGTQWLGYIDTGTLPEGAVNQTLRHDGTNWVATNKISVNTDNRDENDRIRIDDTFATSTISIISKCGDEPMPEEVFPENYHISSIGVSADTQESSVTISAEKIRLALPDNYLKPTGSVLKLKNSEGEVEWGDADIPPQVNSDWNATEGVSQILNKPEIHQGETVNIETLTADKTLTASDATVQIYTSTADRVINLPTTGLTLGQKFEIWNKNSYYENRYLTIKQGLSLFNYITAQTKIELRWDGTNWVNEWRNNIALGYATDAVDEGVAIGFNAIGKTRSASIGNRSHSFDYGVAMGYTAVGYTKGVGIGNNAKGYTYGVAMGNNTSGTNYSVAIGSYAGNGQSRANTLYIHSSTATVGANSLIYGEFDNRIVKINNTLYVNDLVGTGDRPIVADPTGKLKIGTATGETSSTKTKIINRVLTSASSIHSFDNADLGITGDLTTKIFSFELLRKINGNDYFSLGELVQTEKTLTSGAVTFATGEIPSGDTIRLAITYID